MNGGIITRWITNDYQSVSWELEDKRIVRLGFVHRHHGGSWVPVVQHGRLIPLKPCLGLAFARKQITRYHDEVGTIRTCVWRHPSQAPNTRFEL